MGYRELLTRADVQERGKSALEEAYSKYQVMWPDAQRDAEIVLKAVGDLLDEQAR